MDTGTIHFALRGDFSVASATGVDITPRSKKAIGLLAMLAECQTMSRNRRWLQDRLWSDRSPQQASGSLRTTLNEIRKSFGEFADILGSDRKSVWLDAKRITSNLFDGSSSREFLEGLVIGDPEFNDWLIERRVEHNVRKPKQAEDPTWNRRISIQCGAPWKKEGARDIHAQIVNDQVGKIISNFISNSRCSIDDTGADLIVRTAVDENAEGSAILVQVIDPVLDEIVHSDHCFADDLQSFLQNQMMLGRFCWNVADVALEKIPFMRGTQDAITMRSGYVQQALHKVLSFDPKEMKGSIDTLDIANDQAPAGLFLALKAWALTSMIMEDFLDEEPALVNEIKDLLRLSMEASPNDAMVAGVCANVRGILLQDFDGCIRLARQALRHNPNNVFALQAMSVGQAARGDHALAHEISNHTRVVSTYSKFEAMCNLHHALLCLVLKKADEALESSKLAARASPNYRAPRRQMIALNAAFGRLDDAKTNVADLKAVEPDFSLDRFLFDRQYPSNTLRKTGFLEAARPMLRQLK